VNWPGYQPTQTRLGRSGSTELAEVLALPEPRTRAGCGNDAGMASYATARPRLAASIVGQLGRDVGLAESGSKPSLNRCTIQAGSLCYFASACGAEDHRFVKLALTRGGPIKQPVLAADLTVTAASFG
jgi:hypothetical protein